MGLNRREQGIGLLELMLSLAVIAILLVMATRFFGVTHRAQAVNHATKEVTVVLAGMQHWRGVLPLAPQQILCCSRGVRC